MSEIDRSFDLGAEMKRINESHDLARKLARAQFAKEILDALAAKDLSRVTLYDMLWLIELCRKEAE